MRVSVKSHSPIRENDANRQINMPITSFKQASMFNNMVCNMVQYVKSILGSSMKSDNKSSKLSSDGSFLQHKFNFNNLSKRCSQNLPQIKNLGNSVNNEMNNPQKKFTCPQIKKSSSQVNVYRISGNADFDQ